LGDKPVDTVNDRPAAAGLTRLSWRAPYAAEAARPAAWFQIAAGHSLGWPGQRQSTGWLTVRAGAVRMPSVAGTGDRGQEGAVDGYSWIHELGAVDMDELSTLYRIAPLGDKPPQALATVFGNSMFMCFVYAGGVLAGAGAGLG
jgi:hypothetical protein